MKNKENDKIMKENTCRTVVNIPLEIDNEYRNLAKKRGISKSSMILFAMSWYLEYSQSLTFSNKILNMINAETVAYILKTRDDEE